MARTARLSRERIVAEAIALLNEQGLEAVSLRKLAERLGASAPSLSRHVGDKAHLLSLVSSTIFGQALESIEPNLTGDAWLAAFGHALRRKQSETRDISALLSVVRPDDAVDRAGGERLQQLMDQAGLHGPRRQLEQAAIQALVTGWMTFEKSPRAETFKARLPVNDAFDESLRALIAGFAGARSPE